MGDKYPYSTLDLDRLNDIDVFFTNEDQMARYLLELEKIYENKIREIEPDFDLESYGDTSSNVQRTFGVHTDKGELTVQLITIDYYPTMFDLIDSFDFKHCQFATDGKSVIYYDDSYNAHTTKTLEVNKITYPNSSVFRLCKYARQGYKPSLACLGTFAPPVSK